jgi:hypothetical protein
MCLGGPLALLTIKITLATILQHYHLSAVPGATINGKVISTMLTPTSVIPMRVLPASAPFQAARVEGNVHTLYQQPDAELVTE